MTCEELIQYLSAYIDHELSGELRRDAQQHLATCERCQVVLNTTQRLIFLGHGQQQRVISATQRENLYSRLHRALFHEPETP
jgi:anti-sigma factor RsiW